MTAVCAFCDAPIPDTFPVIELGASPESVVQIPACAAHIQALGQLGDAFRKWHWGMAERALGTAPPLPNTRVWIPPPKETLDDARL